MATAYLIALALGITAPSFPALAAVEKSCGDDLQCQADMLTYMQAESGMKERPKPFSHDAKDHVSCGMLQIPCRVADHHNLDGQAAYWVRLRAWSQKACARLPVEARLAALASGSCDRGTLLARDRYETASAALWAVSMGLTVAPLPSPSE
jgi:hypothetical protein